MVWGAFSGSGLFRLSCPPLCTQHLQKAPAKGRRGEAAQAAEGGQRGLSLTVGGCYVDLGKNPFLLVPHRPPAVGQLSSRERSSEVKRVGFG